MQAPTFEENMSDLLHLKEELLRLHFVFSQQAVNYHQVSAISALKDQVKDSQHKIISFQKQLNSKTNKADQQLEQVQKERDELLELNEQLVNSNDQLAHKLKKSQADKEKLQEHNQFLQEEQATKDKKMGKEIENLKLMHEQELYMLRKKEKKI